MRSVFLILVIAFFAYSCESGSFDKDKRQIVAKNAIREKLAGARNFDITGFREDTLNDWPDTTLRRPIQYSLDFQYTDSAGSLQKRNGSVIFTADGRSPLLTRIANPNQ